MPIETRSKNSACRHDDEYALQQCHHLCSKKLTYLDGGMYTDQLVDVVEDVGARVDVQRLERALGNFADARHLANWQLSNEIQHTLTGGRDAMLAIRLVNVSGYLGQHVVVGNAS
jgi:hypothetical protein